MATEKVRVLLVDDRPENLLSLEAMLTSPGYELVSAGSGHDALRQLLVSDCAIILLAVQMLVLDGFETADLIKANPRLKDIPIIFVTALHNDSRYVERGYEAGAVDSIARPIVPAVLQSKVAVFASLHRARQLLRGPSIDITRQKNVEEAPGLRERASTELTALLDVEQILEHTLKLCVPEIAEAGGIHVREDAECGLHASHKTVGTIPPHAQGFSVPLVVQGRTAGHLELWSVRRSFDDDAQEVLIEEVGHRAAQAIGHALLHVRAREAVAHRDEFLSVASHELKTPLAPLKIQIQSCRRRVEQGSVEGLAHKLEVAERQVDRLHTLVNSLLDVSRIRAGRMELEVEEVDLASLVDDVASRFQAELARRNVGLVLRTSAGVRGRWDRSRLDQVISNLLNNGIKYGGGKPIEVFVEKDDARAVLGVKDQGIGINPADKERIFNRFERAVSSQTASGLGLGLYISRQIVKAHGGEIRVETEPGAGAKFVVELPL